MGLITLWENFLPWTQAVVVAPLIARARSPWLKALWYTVLFGTTVAFSVQTYYQFKDYFSYQKMTNTRLLYEPQAPFPAVTFCNLNPFKKSMVPHSQELTNLLAAYTYVNKVKQAQMKSGSTTAATAATGFETHVRKKRQPPAEYITPAKGGCTETEYWYYGSSTREKCSVFNCPDGTAFMEFRACNGNQLVQTRTLPSAKVDSWKDDMATIFYECFRSFCDSGCATYENTLDAIMTERTCLQRKPAYPVLAAIVAQSLATHCNYSDANCSVGMNRKMGSKYGGYYYHRACGAEMTTVFEDCKSPPQIGINYTHSYDITCDKDMYLTDMASQAIWAMDKSNCGAICSPEQCAYSEDTCKGLNYNDFLCGLSPLCNASTTSSFTSSTMSTTMLDLTVETATTELLSPSSTPEMTLTSTTSTLATTASPITLSNKPSTSITGIFITNTDPESTEKKLTTTASETVITTKAPWTSTTATATVDDTSATSTSSRTTTSEPASITTDGQTSTMASSPETTTTPASSPTTTDTSATSKVTTSVKRSSTVKTTKRPLQTATTPRTTAASTSSSPATSMTLPRTTTSASPATSTTLSVSPAAHATTTEAQITMTGTLLSSATISASVSSTDATSETLKTTMTKRGPSSASIKSMMPTHDSGSTTTTGITSTLSTTPGSITMSLSATGPDEASSIATTMAIPTLPASSETTTIHSTRPTAPHSSYANDGSTASSGGSTTESTSASQVPTDAASSVRTTKRSTTTAPAEGDDSSTPSDNAATTEIQSSGTRSQPSMQTSKSSAVSSSNSGVLGTTYVPATSQLGAEVTTVAGTMGSARTTGTATIGSKLTSGTEEPSTSERDGSSHRPTSPSSMTLSPAGGFVLPYPSTNVMDDQDGTQTTATSAMQKTASSSPLNGQDTWSTKGAEVSGSHRSTTLNPTAKSTTKLNEQVSSSTTRKDIESTRSPGDVDDRQDRASSPSVTSGSLELSTVGRNVPTSMATNSGPGSTTRKATASTFSAGVVGDKTNNTSYSPASSASQKGLTEMPDVPHTSTMNDQSFSTAPNNGNNARPTKKSEFNADNSASPRPPTTIANGNSQHKESTRSPSPSTYPMIDGGASRTSITVTDKGQGEKKTTTQSGNDPNNQKSTTTQSSDNSGKHVTTDSDGSVSSGDSPDETSRRRATTNPSDGGVHSTTKESNEDGDVPNAGDTTSKQDASSNEQTTTNYGDYLQNIKLNLSTDFDLEDLNDEQKKNLEDLSTAYGLDPSNSQVVVDGYLKQALHTIAAKMSPKERQTLGFRLKDLVSSCIMDGEPCDMVDDFIQTFDVDFGNCYTFNHDTSVKYISRRAGSSHGLRMVIMSNTTESLPSTAEQGVKIVVHSQDIAPFPNVEGYLSPVGQLVQMQLTQLGAPHGNCSTMESVAKNKQPFYYNGSYSTEGCLRSCFQRNIATACGCADSRFPPPTDMNVPFCDPLDPAKYQCKEAYIQDLGDYFFVKNCQCYDACEDTAYSAQISESDWPAGDFFYGPYCPLAEKMNLSCSEFYSNNGMTLQVSFAQLGYEMKEEEPTTTAWGLANDMAGNSGLWVGCTMLSFAEFILINIQICLWCCRCAKELPEVPSCRRRNFFADVDGNSDGEGSTNGSPRARKTIKSSAFDAFEKVCRKRRRSAVSRDRMAPKNFDNSYGEKELTRREVEAATNVELYTMKQEFESVDPVAAQATEYAGHFLGI